MYSAIVVLAYWFPSIIYHVYKNVVKLAAFKISYL